MEDARTIFASETSSLDRRVVIVGAGHAGGAFAALLRQYGWTGPITLIGEEPIAPYQRPPLSKGWLKGEVEADDLILRPLEFYAEAGIDLQLDRRVDHIDPTKRTVGLSDGETVAYDVLILATGARARSIPLPGLHFEGVRTLRTAADADRLKAALGPGKRLAVIGGGYVGLEAAASARALGAEVVVLEREDRVLARVASHMLSTFFQDYHRARGVVFELGADIDKLVGRDGQVAGVRLADGRTIACDIALIGIGAKPNDELAYAARLNCDGGVVVSLTAQSSDPAIYAIGDVTRRPLPLYGSRLWRLESVPNALEQGRQAAAHLCGKPAPVPETPWFWSDQYDVKLQIAGLPCDVVKTVFRGERPGTAGEPPRFAIFHLSQDDCIVAVEAVNAAPEFMAGRQLIGKRMPVAADRLEDVAIPMKSVAIAAETTS